MWRAQPSSCFHRGNPQPRLPESLKAPHTLEGDRESLLSPELLPETPVPHIKEACALSGATDGHCPAYLGGDTPECCPCGCASAKPHLRGSAPGPGPPLGEAPQEQRRDQGTSSASAIRKQGVSIRGTWEIEDTDIPPSSCTLSKQTTHQDLICNSDSIG